MPCGVILMILSAVTTFQVIAALLFAMFSMLLMIVILLQRGKGVGLAGAFGGAGGTAAFGTKTGDMLTWITIVMFALFIMFAVGLNFLFKKGKATIAAPTATSAESSTVDTQEADGDSEPVINVTPVEVPAADDTASDTSSNATDTDAPAAAPETDPAAEPAGTEDEPSDPQAWRPPAQIPANAIFA